MNAVPDDQRFLQAFEGSAQPICVEQQGRLVYSNPSAQRLAGLDAAAMQGIGTRDLVHPDDAALLVERAAQRQRGEPVSPRFTCRWVVAGARTVWIEASATTIAWEGGPAQLAFLTDVTQRVEAEAALQAALAEQQLIFDNTVAGIGFLRNRVIQRCNPGIELISGYPMAELVGRSTRLLYPSDEAFEAFGRLAQAQFAAGLTLAAEEQLRKKDGTPIWVDIHGKQVDPNDPDKGSIWVWQDISDRKRAEQALHDALLEQAAVFDNIMAGVVVIRNRRVIKCNRAFEALIGYAEAELVGQSTRLYFVSDEQHAAFGPLIYDTVAAGGIARGDYQFRHRSGRELWASYQAKAIDALDLGKGVIFSALEITAHKQLEHDLSHSLAQTRAEAEHKQALADSLAENLRTLEQLSQIGRDITAKLERSAVHQALHRHLATLLDAPMCALFRLEPDGRLLTRVYATGTPDTVVPPPTMDITTTHGLLARAARDRRELLAVPADGLPGSTMVLPLIVADRLLGVLAVQSPQTQAYGERERLVFRSLSAFTAIALSNVAAVEALREAQAQLVLQEKLASLGQLVANVAHEINTPIGAIKASGRLLADQLPGALARLPPLLRQLSPEAVALLQRLIERSASAPPPLSTRDERALLRQLGQQLQQAGLAAGDAAGAAAVLAQCGVRDAAADWAPLLQPPLQAEVLAALRELGGLGTHSANINLAVERVARIVYALKSFSRQGTDNSFVPTDLRENLELVLTLYQHQLRQGVTVQREFDDDLPPLPCQPDALGQVWTNLLHNALQAMGHRGTLVLGLHAAPGGAVVSIRDSGPGMDVALQARIFEPFFTTKPKGEGSGLGLGIARGIVERHGGRIEVESAPGAGSTFRVFLPQDRPG